MAEIGRPRGERGDLPPLFEEWIRRGSSDRAGGPGGLSPYLRSGFRLERHRDSSISTEAIERRLSRDLGGIRWLFGEPDSPRIARCIAESTDPLCSSLTLLETQRALARAQRERPSRVREIRRLRGQFSEASADWHVLEITSDIRIRAGEPFPVEPVRTLDAIHLATALRFATTFPALPVLTFDERILANLEPLGLVSALPRR